MAPNTTGRLRTTAAFCAVLALAACEGATGPGEEVLTEADLDAAVAEAQALEAESPVPDSGRVRARMESAGHGPRPDRPGCCWVDRVGLRVDLGGTAVALATRILDEGDATDEQLALLGRAADVQAAAETALEEGRLAAAVELAGAAGLASLKAVVLPGGVTAEDARAVRALAAALLEDARDGLGDAPTELEEALLVRAGRLFRRGSFLLGEGHVRGVAWLWRSAVTSAYLIAD